MFLEEYILPFIQDVYPDGHKFMQDNDPKHTFHHAQAFFAEYRINWWKTAPESPDPNRHRQPHRKFVAWTEGKFL